MANSQTGNRYFWTEQIIFWAIILGWPTIEYFQNEVPATQAEISVVVKGADGSIKAAQIAADYLGSHETLTKNDLAVLEARIEGQRFAEQHYKSLSFWESMKTAIANNIFFISAVTLLAVFFCLLVFRERNSNEFKAN
jgi:hypothetical protein